MRKSRRSRERRRAWLETEAARLRLFYLLGDPVRRSGRRARGWRELFPCEVDRLAMGLVANPKRR